MAMNDQNIAPQSGKAKRARLWLGLGLMQILALLVFIIWPEAQSEPYIAPADYQERSAAYNLPDMPPDWRYSTFTTADGTVLRWGETGNRAAGQASVLFIPGYTSSMDMYGDHVGRLARRGLHVIGVDLRGQGGSSRHRAEFPQKLYAENFGIYSEDVAALIKAQGFGKDKPLILLGSSFGGHVALRVAGDHDTQTDGLVLLAPAYHPNTAPLSYGQTKFVVGLLRMVGKDKHYAPLQGDWRPDGYDLTAPSSCSSHPARLYLRDTLYMRDPSQIVGGVTNNYLHGLMQSGEYLQDDTFEARLTLPITMIAAENDVIIDSKVSERACKEGLPNCTLKIMPKTGHCLTLENDTVIEAIFDDVEDMAYKLLKK